MSELAGIETDEEIDRWTVQGHVDGWPRPWTEAYIILKTETDHLGAGGKIMVGTKVENVYGME